MENLKALPQLLLSWYAENRRDLPWRRDNDPYHVWLSEIMLQQTRVEAVKGYYERFLSELPTLEALATCDDDRLHKLWEGLGYYSRVRNLKKAALQIIEQYCGNFPESYDQILALPGIGPYTAGAICSIAFDQPTPAVDGNVLRLVSRLTNSAAPIDDPATQKWVYAALKPLYATQNGDLTQAIMELGATICGPNKAPDCEICPCQSICLGYIQGTAGNLPVKAPKKPRKNEERTVFILSCDNFFALEKRPSKGLLAGLWQFPNVSGFLDTQAALRQAESWDLTPSRIYKEVQRSHIFTHIRWDMRGVYVEVREKGGGFSWFSGEEIKNQTALPTAFRQFWEEEDHV